MGEIRIKSGNLADGELEQGSLNSNDGSEVINNTRVRTVENTLLKEGTYTINCTGATGGVVVCAYNTDDLSYDKAASYVGQWRLLPFTFTVDDERLYRFAFKKADDSVIVSSEVTNIQLLEGTYTSETIPEYQPYFLNKPAHQFTNGQFVDIPTHHYINGRWQGELTSQSPLKFRADGEMLDWRVEGKTSGNLYPIEMKDDAWTSFRDGRIISRSDNVLQVLTTDSEQSSGVYTAASSILRQLSTLSDIVSMSADICCDNPDAKISIGFETDGKLLYITTITSDFQHYEVTDFTFSKTQNFIVYCANKQTANIYIKNLMINLGSTALPYEPYGGVGEMTENLFDGEYTYGYIDSSVRTFYIDGNPNKTAIIAISPNTDYVVKKFTESNRFIAIVTDTAPISGTVGTLVNSNNTATEFTFNSGANGNYLVCYVSQSREAAEPHMTVTLGSTAPATYIPYGYKIPVTVGGVTTNLYTDHQLMDGDSIDFTTDQTQIPIATGNNTLTVNTAVQPKSVFIKFEG